LLGGSHTGRLQEQMRNVHPMVVVHPETGRRALYVNELWTERIVGLSSHESDCLLAMLWKHSQSPEFTMRWKWQVNDLALWDNRSFQHYAVMDYNGNRVLQKSYVRWEKPCGPAEPIVRQSVPSGQEQPSGRCPSVRYPSNAPSTG